MTPTKSLLLASAALLTLSAAPVAPAAANERPLILAQNAAPAGTQQNNGQPTNNHSDKGQPNNNQKPPQAQPAKPPATQQQAQPVKPAAPLAHPQQQAQPPKPPVPPVHPQQQAQPPKPPVQPVHPQQQAQPPKPPVPPVHPQQQAQPPKPPVAPAGTNQQQQQAQPVKPPLVPTQPQHQAQPPKPPVAPAGTNQQQQQAQPVKPPVVPTQPQHQAQPVKPAVVVPIQPQQQAQPVKPAVVVPPQPTNQAQPVKPPVAPIPVIAPAPVVQPHNANEFIRKDNRPPARTIQDVKRERTETREGNRVIIREGDRVIVIQNGQVEIHHNEDQRFAIGARNVHVEQRGDETYTMVEQANGIRIISITDRHNRLIRRVRQDPNGRQVVLIDNTFHGVERPVIINVPPPVIRIPHDRYIVEAARVRPAEMYEALEAPPVMVIEQPYTLDQVRFNEPLRARMPRIDLDINFDTGSWQLTPDQIDRMGGLAGALNRSIRANPREVFLIEGHTDAIGTDEDNLSLSDRRAEAVAVALTQQFGVPPENLVTQGYGKQFLKVPTQGPERANRRVAIRRITPLIEQQAAK
jgi:outer membrane protein OmpA-like peptidoglycan-associated protein